MKNILILLMALLCSVPVFAQKSGLLVEGYKAEVTLGPTFTSLKSIPFWMRSMQYGNVPAEGISASSWGHIKKDYTDAKALIDWGVGFEARINGGKHSSISVIEGYVKGRLGIFQLKAGRSKDFDGLVDSTLSTGSFSLSGNAIGIPKVELGIPEYASVPFTNGLLAVKGNLSHGWIGDALIQYGDYNGRRLQTFYHHLSAYGRFGKPDWRLKLYAAVNHDVIWGSDDKIFGTQYDLSWANAFFHVLTGKAYVPPKSFSGQVDISKIGNHQGSFDFALDYKFDLFKINIYHQFFYDKGALAYLANIKDGLTGISFINTSDEEYPFTIKKILLEFLYSKDQAGQAGAKFTPSGPEYYYNHAVYAEGFSYKGVGLGTSMFTPNRFAAKGQINDPSNYFINNRVLALHFGLEGIINNKFNLTFKSTVSRNYGDFRTSGPDTQWFNGKRVPQLFKFGMFKPVDQFSAFLECQYPVGENYRVGFAMAGDYGGLLPKSLGSFVTLTKSW